MILETTVVFQSGEAIFERNPGLWLVDGCRYFEALMTFKASFSSPYSCSSLLHILTSHERSSGAVQYSCLETVEQ